MPRRVFAPVRRNRLANCVGFTNPGRVKSGLYVLTLALMVSGTHFAPASSALAHRALLGVEHLLQASTRVVFLTFDDYDADNIGAWSTDLARRYEDAGVILPCERSGPYRGACTVENVTEQSALLPSTANVAALHGGCLGVPGGFDAFSVNYHTRTDARLTLYSSPDCSGDYLEVLNAPAVDPSPGGQLRFLPLPPRGTHRAGRRAHSIYLKAQDWRLVGLDNVTIIREASSIPSPGASPPSLALQGPGGNPARRPQLADPDWWTTSVNVLPGPAPAPGPGPAGRPAA